MQCWWRWQVQKSCSCWEKKKYYNREKQQHFWKASVRITKNPKIRMETWYDKNVLPSKMIFQLYDPSLMVLLKDFFFLSFQLSPLPLNKLNVFFWLSLFLLVWLLLDFITAQLHLLVIWSNYTSSVFHVALCSPR